MCNAETLCESASQPCWQSFVRKIMAKQPPNINNQRIYAKKFDKNLENKWENTNFALILKKLRI